MSGAHAVEVAELSVLRRAADQVALRHRGRLIAIVASPRARARSRSRTVLAEAEKIARESRLDVATAWSGEAGASASFGLFRQLFADAVAATTPERRAELFAGAAAFSEPVLASETVSEQVSESPQSLHGIYWLIGNASWEAARAGRGGLALLIEGLDGADRASLRALSYLADRLDDVPVLLIGTVLDTAAVSGAAPGLLDHPRAQVLRPAAAGGPSGLVDPGSASTGLHALARLAAKRARRGGPATQTRLLADRAWDSGALLDHEGPDREGWSLVVEALISAGSYGAAADVASTVAQAAHAAGLPAAAAAATAGRSSACFRAGLLQEAIADATSVLATDCDVDEGARATALAVRALALVEQDQPGEARDVLERATEDQFTNSTQQPTLLDAAGWISLASRDPSRACAEFERAGRLFERAGVRVGASSWRCGLALSRWLIGDQGGAVAAICREHELASRVGAPASIGHALRVRGMISGGSEGLADLARAVGLLSSSEAGLEYVAALVDLGGALRRAGMRAQARRPLHLAVKLSDARGALRLGRRAREELRAAGGRMRSGMEALHPLTPSEHRVAKLAAEGHTNREIAQELFVTAKAVEWHLANVYRKLEIKSRRRLHARLEQFEEAS